MLLTMSTTNPHTNSLLSMLSNWHTHKSSSTFLTRLGMRTLEVLTLALAMFLIPTLLHRGVQSLDEIHELLGRRARSPYTSLSWGNVVLAGVLMLVWHAWLGRLAYQTILETPALLSSDDSAEEEEGSRGGERISWDRVLGRIVLPLLLLMLGGQFAWILLLNLRAPKGVVAENTVDMQDAVGQLYGLR